MRNIIPDVLLLAGLTRNPFQRALPGYSRLVHFQGFDKVRQSTRQGGGTTGGCSSIAGTGTEVAERMGVDQRDSVSNCRISWTEVADVDRCDFGTPGVTVHLS